jgi:hypothetical protein
MPPTETEVCWLLQGLLGSCVRRSKRHGRPSTFAVVPRWLRAAAEVSPLCAVALFVLAACQVRTRPWGAVAGEDDSDSSRCRYVPTPPAVLSRCARWRCSCSPRARYARTRGGLLPVKTTLGAGIGGPFGRGGGRGGETGLIGTSVIHVSCASPLHSR